MAGKLQKSVGTDEHRRLGQLLRTLRMKAGLTRAELAEQLGKPQSFVARCEAGERRLDLLELRVVCEALGIGIVNFVGQS